MHPSQSDEHSEIENTQIPLKKYAIIAVITIVLLGGIVFLVKTSSASNSIDSRLSELKQLRENKKGHEAIIEKEKNAIYVIDSKIIPMKCKIYSEIGANFQYEQECAELHDEQQKNINAIGEKSLSDIPE